MTERLARDGGTPVRTRPFPTRAQSFGEEDLQHLREVLQSGHLSRVGGAKTKAVEEQFASLLGVKHALAVTSGTAAIHTAVGMIDPDPGDEIITTPLTDMGTVIGILFQNAIPIFADVLPGGYHLDPESVRRNLTDRTRAIIVVHLWGMAADMEAFLQIGEEYGIPIIEDCAQAYFTSYQGKHVGTMGKVGCFSLQQSKHLTAGDGGLVVTNDDDLAYRGRLFADKGWDRSGAERGHLFLGMNYRISELQSAVALAQLGKLKERVLRRQQLGDLLTSLISDLPGLRPPATSDVSGNTYWFYALAVEEQVLGRSREWFMSALNAEGVPCWGWLGKPLYLFEALLEQRTFGKSHHPFDSLAASRRITYGPGLCPNAEQTLREVIALTVHEFYTEEDIADLATAIRKVAAAAL